MYICMYMYILETNIWHFKQLGVGVSPRDLSCICIYIIYTIYDFGLRV